MIRSVCFILLVISLSVCAGYDFSEVELLPREAQSDGIVRYIDYSVKEKLVNLISLKWNETLTLYEANSDRYALACQQAVESLAAECKQCAAKACEPNDIEKLKLLLRKGVKEVGKGLKKTVKEAERAVKKVHEAVKKTAKKLVSGAKKVVSGVVKGVRKVVRKVTRTVTRVVRSVTRVIRRVVRVRIPTPRIRIRFRRRWGKRNIKQRMINCAMECSSCQSVQIATDTDNYVGICGVDTEGERLLNKLKALDNAYPSDEVPIVTQITKETRDGSERTIVKMTLQDQSRETVLPSSFFYDLGKLQTATFNALKASYGDLFL